MVLPASGPLSFAQIEDEFGQIPGPNNRKLGSYRVSTTFSDITVPLDTTAGADNNTPIPSSGSISFSNFRNARLNIVVNCYDSGTEYTTDAKVEKYDNGQATVVGPGDVNPLPNNTSGKRIIIHVNKKFGSQFSDEVNGRNYCALKTGTWTANTKLQIDVGGQGKIMGAGGRGGNPNGNDGALGTSGLGIQHEGTVVNVLAGGAIIAGWGGGASGSEGSDYDWWSWKYADGGGGGGGAGLPPGAGGNSGGEGAQAGQAGSEPVGGEQGGAGGQGGNDDGEAIGGVGGRGGDQLDAAQAGQSRSASGGAGGNNGAAIRRSSGSISWTYGATHVGNVWGAGSGGSSESGTGVS